jgi:hypothetical protein
VAQQLAAALPAIVAQLNPNVGNNSGDTNLDNPPPEDANPGNLGVAGNAARREEANGVHTIGGIRKGCTYESFMSCKPKDFYGKGGAVEDLQWIEEMESILDISNCSDELKVKYASHSLKGEALSWWNMVLQTRGRDAVSRLKWEEFKNILVEKYCPYNEVEKIEAEF